MHYTDVYTHLVYERIQEFIISVSVSVSSAISEMLGLGLVAGAVPILAPLPILAAVKAPLPVTVEIRATGGGGVPIISATIAAVVLVRALEDRQ